MSTIKQALKIEDIDCDGVKDRQHAGARVDLKIPVQQIDACRCWLRSFTKPAKRTGGQCTSYNFKHRVEEWLGKKKVRDSYICNGAFIVAAILEGYAAYQIWPRSPNAVFNFKLSSRRRGI